MLLTANLLPGIFLTGLQYVIICLIGMTWFSYLNIVMEVLPVDYSFSQKKGLLTKGRTTCPYCGREWKWKDSIPVFSWIYNRKMCRYCLEPISARHSMIEAFGGIVAVLVVLYYNITLEALMIFLLFSVLMVIAIIDYDTHTIPDILNEILAGIGVLSIFVMPGPTIIERMFGVFCVSIPMLIVILLVPEGFGGGDIKMMAVIGIFLGWKATVCGFFFGLILGGIYGAYLMFYKKKGKKEQFPFGPFLSAGIAVATYADIGEHLMQHYIEMIQGILEKTSFAIIYSNWYR